MSTGTGYIIGNFLLTLNRYTAMKYPVRHKKVSRLSIGIVAFGYLLAATPLNLMTIDALIKYKKRNGVNIQSSEKVRLIVN
ncbi:hypothetical protein WR25_00341 [Diploscapter pachys]|uniref:Uncharacterized protein n=1 Tax=Diploscapter pachys TaxID=2018661 RepID=A0A2A2L6K7_9BILA|nr:hypothetical protein WR25_00341 [Diploscapter pachys]